MGCQIFSLKHETRVNENLKLKIRLKDLDPKLMNKTYVVRSIKDHAPGPCPYYFHFRSKKQSKETTYGLKQVDLNTMHMSKLDQNIIGSAHMNIFSGEMELLPL